MLKKMLIGLAVTVLVFAAVVALQPSDFRIARSATLSAPPAIVFSQVNDFHKWEAWSPWAKMDPAAKNSFEDHRRDRVPSSRGPAMAKWGKGA